MSKKLFLLSLFKLAVLLIAGTAILGFGLYSAAWFALTSKANATLTALSHDKSLAISGDIPTLKGYPKPPEAEFVGSIEDKRTGIKIETPLLYYSGFPINGQLQYLEAPNGLVISAPFLEENMTFKFAALQIQTPLQLPKSNLKKDIADWQKLNTPLVVHKIVLKSDQISAIGQGTIQLDDNLQIKADIAARVTGMDALFDELEKKHGQRTMAIARNFLNMMSKVDPANGERYFETTLRIQNRGVYFGPMRLSGLPEIKWDEN